VNGINYYKGIALPSSGFSMEIKKFHKYLNDAESELGAMFKSKLVPTE